MTDTHDELTELEKEQAKQIKLLDSKSLYLDWTYNAALSCC
jgi:hypothetical protein